MVFPPPFDLPCKLCHRSLPASPSGPCHWVYLLPPTRRRNRGHPKGTDQSPKFNPGPVVFFIFCPCGRSPCECPGRGVNVQILLDKSPPDELYIANGIFVNVGISIKIDSAHAIGQNKVMIIDGETIITGSFNFTKAAEDKNAVNLLVIRDKATAKKYTKSWQYHEGHSEPYSGRGR